MSVATLGRTNSLTDVTGLRVGHASRVGDGWLTGTTVVVAGKDGAVAGVDVRGGGPGTRETDLLEPCNLVERIHAVVLSGGSAFGLASADGVVAALADDAIGLAVGSSPDEVVPIVPAAIIFDLGRGGVFRHHPDADLGRQAYLDASGAQGSAAVRQGCVGAGTGAVAGGLKGGLGSASAALPSGWIVAALAVANPGGSCVDPASGRLWAAECGLPGEFDQVSRRARPAQRAISATGERPFNTTIGVVATDAPLTKPQCQKLAQAAHDGLARAVRPAHSMFDGDTVFGLSTATTGPQVPAGEFNQLLAEAADCFARAVGHGLLAAVTCATPAGTWESYAEVHLGPGEPRGV